MSGGTGDEENLPTDSLTRYGPFFGTDICTVEDNCAVVLAVGGTASNLHARATAAPGFTNAGVAKSWTFTVMKNGAAETALQCSISGSSQTCSDTTGSVSFSAGDRVSIRITAAENPSGSEMGSWSVAYS